MSVLCVGYDAAPCDAFSLMLEGERSWRGILADAGRNPIPDWPTIGRMVRDSRVVILGMSSEKTSGFERDVATQAISMGKPTVWFSDTWGCHARGWFAPFRHLAQGIFVVHESEVEAAQEALPKAKVSVVPNPSWEGFFNNSGDRDAERAKMGAEEDDKVIFISGTKDAPVNLELLTFTLAGSATLKDSKTLVVFSQHPGDGGTNALAQLHIELYENMIAQYPGVRARILPKRVPGKSLVYGADVTVTYNAASLAVATVARRQPLVCLATPLANDRLFSESGSRKNPLVESGAALGGGQGDVSMLAAVLAQALDPHACASLTVAQEAFLPQPRVGEYIARFARAVSEPAH